MMMRTPELIELQKEHNLKLELLINLLQYRKEHEILVECVAKAKDAYTVWRFYGTCVCE